MIIHKCPGDECPICHPRQPESRKEKMERIINSPEPAHEEKEVNEVFAGIEMDREAEELAYLASLDASKARPFPSPNEGAPTSMMGTE